LTVDKMLATLRQNGVVQGTMYLFLLYFSARLTKELGMAPGGEFRRAFIEARNVPGCIIQLGDRPIEVFFIDLLLFLRK
jgi:pheromone shutdown protein TraB